MRPCLESDCANLAPPATAIAAPGCRFNSAISAAGSPAASLQFSQSTFFRVREKTILVARFISGAISSSAVGQRQPSPSHALVDDASHHEDVDHPQPLAPPLRP